MASKDQGADKTEKPTAKRIRDARKEGNVSKSRDLTATVLTLAWLIAGWLLTGFMFGHLRALFNESLRVIQLPFNEAVIELSGVAVQTLLWLTLPFMLMALMIGVAVEFLQVGPIATMKKVAPKMDKLNPVEGIKKMFSMDNLVELIKSIVKSTALIGIGVYVLLKMMPDLLQLPYGPPSQMGAAIWHALVRIAVWTIVVFFFISALDVWYQKFSYTKQLRMSRRDIKQEVKENEGDPYVKSRRRQLHQEWAQQNMLSAVRGANVVVTNPTHIAVALQYEDGVTGQGRRRPGRADQARRRGSRGADPAEHPAGARPERKGGAGRLRRQRILRRGGRGAVLGRGGAPGTRRGHLAGREPALVAGRHPTLPSERARVLRFRQARNRLKAGQGPPYENAFCISSSRPRLAPSRSRMISTYTPSSSMMIAVAIQALIGKVSANTFNCGA